MEDMSTVWKENHLNYPDFLQQGSKLAEKSLVFIYPTFSSEYA